MIAKYPGKCAQCGVSIPAGEQVKWDREKRVISHIECPGNGEQPAIPAASTPQYEPIKMVPGSYEQEAIWAFLLNETPHLVMNCGPGTGKTFSSVQYCLRAPKSERILFVAFNKHIADEANGKLRASGCSNVRACTSHSLGFSILRDNFKTLAKVAPDENKMKGILEKLSPAPVFGKADWRRTLNLAEKLCEYVKGYLLDYEAVDFKTTIEAIADRQGLEMNGLFNKAFALIKPALDECKRMAPVSIDYNDMIWLPIVLDLEPLNNVDTIIVDEAQDLAPSQHELIFRYARLNAGRFGEPKSSSRVVVVGDRRQSIYSWRGAAHNSIEQFAERLANTRRGVKELPLTITRRCPKLHVELAKNLYPEIQALDDAPVGEILQMSHDKAIAEMRAGDMAICRINKELITTAYALIRRKVRPQVKGRDIGKGLLQFITTLLKIGEVIPGPEMVKITEALNIYRNEKLAELAPLGDRAEGRIQAVNDKCDCMLEFITNSQSVAEIQNQIETLFTDDVSGTQCVVLGTIHRTKGLEAERVFVLAPSLIPHPMARQDWAKEEERHIAWIAATRAKFTSTAPGTIVFCGCIPPIYSPRPKPAPLPVPTPTVTPCEAVAAAVLESAGEIRDLNELAGEHTTPGLIFASPRGARLMNTAHLEQALDRQEEKHNPDPVEQSYQHITANLETLLNEEEDHEPPF